MSLFGTTPAMALSPFGRRVGEPLPLLKRMTVDYEGVNTVGAFPALIFTRPSTSALVHCTVLQFGFPVATPLVIDGVEFWLLDPSAAIQFDAWSSGLGSWRFPFTIALGAVPNTSVISAQLFSLVTCNPSTWGGSACIPYAGLPGDLTVVGGPAMFFQF